MSPQHSRFNKSSGNSGNPEIAVHTITDAGTAHSEEMRQRMIRYALAMGIRIVCLGLIFVVDGWFKILMVAGAVFLPWFAVVIANGGDKAEVLSDSLLDAVPQRELDSPLTPTATSFTDEPIPTPETLIGEIVPSDDQPTDKTTDKITDKTTGKSGL
ncbi:DUF3099 domain-containing protein [Pseudarthrobacter sp. J1738]|uniref:DUF3099 domain-containing protein n=1 Tax=unclassified Pseudarthrobacter TaxID=2647000 RepID=UPI003D2A4559